MRFFNRILIGLFALFVIVVFASTIFWQDNQHLQSHLVTPLQQATGFAHAEGPQPLSFPDDHGPHPDFLTEWWYYTGNLENTDGDHFGYQLTFFRRALAPPVASTPNRESAWASDQVYIAHFALTDVSENQHQAFERFSRGAVALAGVRADPFKAWLEDWYVEQVGVGTYRLVALDGELAIDLTLKDTKGPILQGNQGYSQKGPRAGNASFYISQTRLATTGTVKIGDNCYEVNGLSWMDHEYSTGALSEEQIGWDWFSVQLDDNTELMLFQIRREDGSIDSFSSGTLIVPDGSTRPLARDDFTISVSESWRSSISGATYPAAWDIDVPSAGLSLSLEPHVADQEMNAFIVYWEGAVRVIGQHEDQTVSGNGYIEMTGYAEPIAGEF